MKFEPLQSWPRPSPLEFCFLAIGLFFTVHYAWMLDDAYVYFRYVDNWLLLDRGLVFNPGEYVAVDRQSIAFHTLGFITMVIKINPAGPLKDDSELFSELGASKLLCSLGQIAQIQISVRSLALRFTVARRDFNGACECLAAQARLARPPRGRSAGRFTRRECFSEALLLRKILGPVSPGGDDPLPLWKELAGEERGHGPGKKKRRRRRGGRRRREKRPLSPRPDEGKGEACPDESASSSAPAPRKPPNESPDS